MCGLGVAFSFWKRLGLAMGLLTNIARGLLRGADRTAVPTTKRRGPRAAPKWKGPNLTGFHTPSAKFIKVKEMVPEFVVPDLNGFHLKPYVSYRAPDGTEEPQSAEKIFMEVVAPLMEKDIKEGSFNLHNLEKYGFEPTQEGKLFQLYPKNYAR
ncbi:large ribosomal subunit protein mL41 isoform X2 [Microcaecilia unicolor]|uniref:39S ribosomal protein L41, mitochondrial isoform X2 n=1 Tax=Microcaecilia unicolor TaxID=1415580 RepID=A0A6P7YG48_9AMPH|nr:39S ribosomal protein L41, mitochondrial isoform X2 [Microcaecilia unicolor]